MHILKHASRGDGRGLRDFWKPMYWFRAVVAGAGAGVDNRDRDELQIAADLRFFLQQTQPQAAPCRTFKCIDGLVDNGVAELPVCSVLPMSLACSTVHRGCTNPTQVNEAGMCWVNNGSQLCGLECVIPSDFWVMASLDQR